ncbi:Alpha/Beta hydrolase protein [Talaromyces proteolyticus]|uniref:Alpha/Beta hydrolase protein n=1 Tax=Talaromyces proteolyticus TaxID=1131652 RepID=A0AAD4KYN4_9EURO|nr:Alpha/Beta hydrolase protein [Talaromyces proteolyticus]KAH8698946.1 Alpha/Beta hydrolase protein [Talaromyces proteolyticus]
MSDPALAAILEASANVDNTYPDFEILESYYTSGNGRDEIRLHVLMPKSLLDGHQQQVIPLMVRIHGGYLITGSGLYRAWFSDWTLEYAKQAGAVIVSPNYRLMPESNGTEILEDMDSFWRWLRQGGVDTLLAKNGFECLQIDHDQTLVLGESAGGYLAMQLALSYPDDIQALIAVYPLLDLQSEFYTRAYSKPISGVQNRPLSVIEDHLDSIRSTPRDRLRPVTEADPPDRLELSFAVVQHGRFLEFLGQDNPRLFPIKRITDDIDADAAGKGERLPPMFIFHGKDDSAVPYQGTIRFIETLTKTRPLAKYRLESLPGDHGFDIGTSIGSWRWLQDGLQFIALAWLKKMRMRQGLVEPQTKI